MWGGGRTRDEGGGGVEHGMRGEGLGTLVLVTISSKFQQRSKPISGLRGETLSHLAFL